VDIGYLPVKFREVDHKDTQWFYWHEYIPLFEQQVLLWADLDPVSPNVEKKVKIFSIEVFTYFNERVHG
jgi:hypothetical protein